MSRVEVSTWPSGTSSSSCCFGSLPASRTVTCGAAADDEPPVALELSVATDELAEVGEDASLLAEEEPPADPESSLLQAARAVRASAAVAAAATVRTGRLDT
jgi:hypothetical protein